jgi:high-affinity Fe2+/Pb2+ permease
MKMQDLQPSTETAGWLAPILYKLLPAGIGAAVMVAVQLPETKREWFNRIFVALACSLLFTDLVFDGLHSLAWLSFLNEGKKSHVAAVAGLVGASAWFVMGGFAMWLRKFRGDPAGAIEDAKKAVS